jgi:hypothetical protein
MATLLRRRITRWLKRNRSYPAHSFGIGHDHLGAVDVTVKKKRSAATEPLMPDAPTPVFV